MFVRSCLTRTGCAGAKTLLCGPSTASGIVSSCRGIVVGSAHEGRKRRAEKFAAIENDPFDEGSTIEANWRALNYTITTTPVSTDVRDIRLINGKNMLVRNVRMSERWFSLYEYPTGKFVRHLFDDDTKALKPTNAAFFKNGERLAVQYEGDLVVVWDVESGEKVRTLKLAGNGCLRHNSRSIFRGNKMLWSSGKSLLSVHDLETGKLDARYECAQPAIGDIRFDGRLLALHLEGGPVQILDLQDGSRRQVHFLGDTTAPMGIPIGLVSELDQIFVKTGENVHVHDVVTGEHLGTWAHHRGPLPAWNYYKGRMFGIFDLSEVFIHRFNGHAWSNSLQTYDFPINPVGFVNERLFLTTTAEHNDPTNTSVFQLWSLDEQKVVRQLKRDWTQTLSCQVGSHALDFITHDEKAQTNVFRHYDFEEQ